MKTVNIGKNGRPTYLIRVSDGYGPDGRQHRVMTWRPPVNMSEKKAGKAAQIGDRFADAVMVSPVKKVTA